MPEEECNIIGRSNISYKISKWKKESCIEYNR